MLLERPTREQLEQLLRHAMAQSLFAEVVGTCEVIYVGRAASLTQAGEYCLILKPDGSLQVHGARGVKPINWQPRTDKLSLLHDEDEQLVLLATRNKPEEMVQITFYGTTLAFAVPMRDETLFELHGSEAELQTRLAKNPEFIETGLKLLDKELPIDSGGIDLFAEDANGNVVVVELKRGKATQEAVHQLSRYVDTVRQHVGITSPNKLVRGILAAPSISKPARVQLEKINLEFVEIAALPEQAEPKEAQVTLF